MSRWLFLIVPLMCAAEPVAKPTKPSAQEPFAAFSAGQAATALDLAARNWTQTRKCGTCHTNYPFLLARPALGKFPSKAERDVRGFFEQRIAHWDRGEKGDAPRWPTEVVATAATLALADARTTGKLQPATRTALDRMWKVQRDDGAWSWLKCNWPPLEHDDYYGAVYAALAVGQAPDKYIDSTAAKAGVTKLRKYLTKTPAPDLHHAAMLLWASEMFPDLLTADQQAQTVKELRAAQQPDGGWSTPSLGKYIRHDGSANNQTTSDGYGTGLAVVVLRSAGVPANDPALVKAVTWLRKNQRESGRWFTRSPSTDANHYLTNAGTSFAILALSACGKLD